jgi:Flp pilus assembly protein TadG
MTARSFLRRAEGTTAVEFALTSPIYFLALFGLAQVSLWLWADFSLQQAVDAASRCAVVLKTTCGDVTATEAYAANAAVALPVTSSAFKATNATCGWQVTATYSVPTFIPALPNISVNVSACYPT